MARKEKCDKNPLVGIAGAIGGTAIGMIALLVIFAPDYAWTSIFVVMFMAILGIFLGHYATKKK